jgi:hypothetical protein
VRVNHLIYDRSIYDAVSITYMIAVFMML